MNAIGIDLLNNFSEKEIIGLSAFVTCTHFNTDKHVVRLLEVLKRDVLGKKKFGGALRHRVYEKVFSDKVAAKGWTEAQRKLMSAKLTNLTRLAERFLSIEALEENQVYRSDLLYQKLLEKRQYILFERTLKREKKALSAQVERDLTYHSRYNILEKNSLDYLHRTERIYKEDNIPDRLHHLNIKQGLEKLSVYMTVLSLEIIRDKNYDTPHMTSALQLLDLPEYADHPILKIYKLTINLMQQQSKTTYHSLLEMLTQHAAHIPQSDLSGFYGTMTNFCIDQIRKEQFSYRDLFELYQRIEARNLFVEGNFVSAVNLKNVIAAACRVREFDWAETITNKYNFLIKKEIQASVYRFNLGVIAFYRKDYNIAIPHFASVDNFNADYYANCKILMVKAHYETDEGYDERTVQIFRAAEKFFKHNAKLSSVKKKRGRNFSRLLIYIYKFQHRNTKITLESIKTKLDKQVVTDRNWLLEKIEQL